MLYRTAGGNLFSATGRAAPDFSQAAYLVIPVFMAAAAVTARAAKRGSAPGRVAAISAVLAAAATIATIVGSLVLSQLIPAGLAIPAMWLAAGAATGNLAAEALWRTPLSALRAPARGEVWWATVEFEESRKSKDRPCLVLSGTGRRRKALMFTSQDKSGRRGYLPAPRSLWQRPPTRSFLKTDRVITIRIEKFRRRESIAPTEFLSAATKARRS